MALNARAIVDLHVARLGRIPHTDDVHRLPPGRDRELDRLGHCRRRRRRVRHAPANADALDGRAKLGVHRRRLRHRRLSAEGDCDRVL